METKSMSSKATVFVVDDSEPARKSVCTLVRSLGLPAEAFASAEEFLTRYVPGHPGCLVTDVRMLGMSGLDLQERLIERGISLPVIVLTAYPQTRTTVRALKAGAVTLLEKPYDEEELWDAIRIALAHDAERRSGIELRQEIQGRAAKLSPAERSVMTMIVQGLPNKVIAKRLNISIRTIESRRHEVFEKMQVESVAELVRIVIVGKLDQQTNLPSG
jgi:two-component system, LuxR family, response regulator FixJ